jgi:hydroxypyruvate isomerase
MVLHNLPAGTWAAGDRGIACHPGRQEEFREGVRRALQYADALGVPRLNCLAGIAPAGVDAATLRRTFVENARHAAAELKAAGRVLVIEPINPYDVPGFWLNRTDDAVNLLDEIGADNAFVQYDLYHAQRTHGELCGTLSRHLARIGHLQIADNPGVAPKPDQLAAGISTALVTTLIGLWIAIPAILFFQMFKNWLEEINSDASEETQRLMSRFQAMGKK